jgi:proline racemase
MALMYARGELAVGETFKHYSLLDTEFTCSIVAATRVSEIPAVVTNIGGRAWLTVAVEKLSCHKSAQIALRQDAL